MDQKTFEELINNSGLLNKDTLSELEQLLKEYPFCQTFHLLYTKNLSQLKHIRYNQQLKIAAAVVGDRTRLKHYIEDSDFIVDIAKEHSFAQFEVKAASVKMIDNETIEIPVKDEPFNIVQEEEEAIDESTVTNQTDFTPDLNSSDNIDQVEDYNAKSSSSDEWDREYELILSSTLDAKISREEKKKAIIALINKKFSERKVEADEIMPEKGPGETKSIVTHEIRQEINVAVQDILVEESKEVIETGDYQVLDSLPVMDLSVDNSIEETDLDYLEGFSVTTDAEKFEELIPVSEKKEVTASNVLIENFLRDAPRMPRPKKEFFNPVNLAARSVVENEDFYTETYAAICLKQGNVSKAIKIYEKLSLKFPEKSSYFAGLIEKIKKEKNI